MKSEAFIARRLEFKGKMAVIAIAISFFIVILAQCISAGFSREIRDELAGLTGDISLKASYRAAVSEDEPISAAPSYLGEIAALKGVESVEPAVYCSGVVRRAGGGFEGVLFKGVGADSASMTARIPSTLAESFGLSEGDGFTAYFVGADRMKARRFTVAGIYDSPISTDTGIIIYASPGDLRRILGWQESDASAIEIHLDSRLRSPSRLKEMEEQIRRIAEEGAADESEMVAVRSARDDYASIFDWLELVDVNVYAILLLMTLVAGFNMISGLLILLFRNISTIGTLKALGMNDRSLSGVFLRVGARITGTGMLAGNLLALLFCVLQGATHLVKLDPSNYFISYVPVFVDPGRVLLTDAVCFGVILLLLLIPTMFISRVDPASTVKTE